MPFLHMSDLFHLGTVDTCYPNLPPAQQSSGLCSGTICWAMNMIGIGPWDEVLELQSIAWLGFDM